MRIVAKQTLLLAFSVLLAGASGCIYEREVVRDRVPRSLPPPRPGDDDDRLRADRDSPPPPGDEIDDDVFYEPLSPYGHWEWVPDHGRVWVPVAAVGWRPYYFGHWVLTEWGWTFVSPDPWGWAVYHYGSWGFSASVGWFWVPGHVWAPAWVTWRYGFGYCAWAPIGPRGFVYGVTSPAWVAVREEHFTRPIVQNALPPQQTAPIVQSAPPLSGPQARPVQGSFGPPVARVRAAVGEPIRAVNVSTVLAHPPAGGLPPGPRARIRDGAEFDHPRSEPGAGRPTDRPRGDGPRAAPRTADGPFANPRDDGAGRATPRDDGQGRPGPRAEGAGGRARDDGVHAEPRDDRGVDRAGPRDRGGIDRMGPRDDGVRVQPGQGAPPARVKPRDEGGGRGRDDDRPRVRDRIESGWNGGSFPPRARGGVEPDSRAFAAPAASGPESRPGSRSWSASGSESRPGSRSWSASGSESRPASRSWSGSHVSVTPRIAPAPTPRGPAPRSGGAASRAEPRR